MNARRNIQCLKVTRVMAFVQKAVARLYEPEKLDLLLRELGKKHYSYGAKQQYIDYIAPQFIQAIKPSLEDRWTGELQDAWIALFNYMGVIMKAAMDWEEKRAAAATIPYALPPSSHPSKTGAPAPVNPTAPPVTPAPPTNPTPPINPPPPVAAATNITKEPNRRASDVITNTRKGTGVRTEALRRGTLN
ncbi:hypothetical protein J437_LFUL018322 [Ladona fulva]|uniref:Globin domain-containing protein n=1 Tax=Ladona fulva TaxID=123851 RepID=A0A8K0KUC2_LADFU|nr:hypothetical protein J437_LFUL018322 [Ladona fulva]